MGDFNTAAKDRCLEGIPWEGKRSADLMMDATLTLFRGVCKRFVLFGFQARRML
jgi:hypothetical protein